MSRWRQGRIQSVEKFYRQALFVGMVDGEIFTRVLRQAIGRGRRVSCFERFARRRRKYSITGWRADRHDAFSVVGGKGRSCSERGELLGLQQPRFEAQWCGDRGVFSAT